MGGQVVYLGRGGSHAGQGTSTICSRVGAFIACCMGFWLRHSGGERFYRESDHHPLCVRDLEVSWALDDDPICREGEELVSLPALPRFNVQGPHTCQQDDCPRASALWANHQVW
jgi:hypothetical protein